MKYAIDYYGIDHVMYGTDYPCWDPATALRLIDEIGLSESEREKLFYSNAQRILGLSDHQPLTGEQARGGRGEAPSGPISTKQEASPACVRTRSDSRAPDDSTSVLSGWMIGAWSVPSQCRRRAHSRAPDRGLRPGALRDRRWRPLERGRRAARHPAWRSAQRQPAAMNRRPGRPSIPGIGQRSTARTGHAAHPRALRRA